MALISTPSLKALLATKHGVVIKVHLNDAPDYAGGQGDVHLHESDGQGEDNVEPKVHALSHQNDGAGRQGGEAYEGEDCQLMNGTIGGKTQSARVGEIMAAYCDIKVAELVGKRNIQ
ncbi:hypothetical protein AX16_000916 [Volvariella volvacea WC 439]|nr:hypothetical protein AX16_000916 [Volvariella volvacea WC 439]